MTQENFDNLPVTKGDLKELIEKMVTKDDLKSFATKDDLKNFATKHDLDKFRDEVEVSFKELGEAIHLFAEHVDKRFDLVEKDVTKINATMVTKDYLDEKMADQRGDLTVLMRKEDTKVKTLVEVLVEKKVLNEVDPKRIYSLEPFAQI